MCLDIDRSPAQQQIERKQAGKQTLAATPCHNHQYRRHSDVRTGKSSRGALTHLLGTLHQVVEEAVLIARTGKKFLMVMEIVTDGREDTSRHMVASNGGEVELRPGNGDEDINKVIDEESGDDDERNLLEKVETIKEIPHHHQQNHRIIEEVSHIERLAHPHLRKPFTEPHSRLSTKHPLLHRREHVVEIGEYPVELKGVGIPIGKQ